MTLVANLLGLLGHEVRILLRDLSDFIALFFILVRAQLRPAHASRRRIFYKLYRRQIFYTAVQALPTTIIIAGLIGSLLVFSLPALTGGEQIVSLSSELFSNLILREVAPLLCTVILITRSGSAVTAKIGFLKVFRQFEVLKSMGINPVHIFLVPVFFAFPISILILLLYFDLAGLAAASASLYLVGGITDPTILFEAVVGKITGYDLGIMLTKGLASGIIVGLYAIHYGAYMRGNLTHVAAQMSSSMTRMLVTAYLVNILISLLAYQA